MKRNTVDWKNLDRDGRSLKENIATQPKISYKIFSNPEAITKGWYPVFPSHYLKTKQVRSWKILDQRLVFFRGLNGKVSALDAFCPHFGADLGNGEVVGNHLRCRLHHWKFNGKGDVIDVPCLSKKLHKNLLSSYPAKEELGYIWVFSDSSILHEFPCPPGLEDQEMRAICLGNVKLFAHHHIMMINGIDLQHFKAVHNLDLNLSYEAKESSPGVFDWHLEGDIPDKGYKAKLGKFLLGDKFRYRVRFSGGSMVAITYGWNQRFRGVGKLLPSLHIIWGCTPLKTKVSEVTIFIVTKKRPGLIGYFKSLTLAGLTMALLAILKDEDVKAFPYFRFSPNNTVDLDSSSLKLVDLIESLSCSSWSQNQEKQNHVY